MVCGGSAAWAFNNRAQAYYRERDYDDAIADFTEVIRRDPTAEVLRLRGRAYSAKGDYDQAFADWTRSIGLDQAHTAYWLLWTYIEDGHTGKSGTPWAEMNKALAAGVTVAHLKREDWPYPIIEFYLGNRSAAEMLSAATKPNEQCEAQFYLGEWYMLRGNRAAATAALRIAVNACRKNFYEYDGAAAELTRMKRKASHSQ